MIKFVSSRYSVSTNVTTFKSNNYCICSVSYKPIILEMMQEYTTDGTNDSSEELHVVSGQLLTLNDPIEVMDTVVSKNNNITSPLQLIQDVVDDDVNFFDIEQGKQVDNVDNNYDDNKDDDELIVIKGRSLEMNDQLPDWASVVDQDSKSNLITTAINKHITDKTLIDRLNKFSIRLHNALYSIDNSINLSAKAIVTAKISLLPVPAKAFILRSSIPIPTSISSPSSSPNSLTSTTSTTTAIHQQYYDFSFGKKIASLSMSAGDVRSKSFKDGACPRLNIDLNLSNGETIFNSNLQLYLPQLLLSYQSGQLLSLPLVNTSSNSILATIIIELICPQKNSTISDNNIINIVYKDKSNHANSINKNIFIFNSKIIALTGKSLVNIKSEVLDEAKNKYYVDVKLTASGGISKRIDLKLNPTFRSEYLEFNHDEDNVKNTNNNDHHHPDSLLDMKSINPGLDILNLSFRRGPYDEDELGFIQIPIIFLQNLDLAGKSSDLLIALIAWKMIINVDQRCMFTSSKFSFIWKLLSIHPILDTENLQLNDRNEEVDHDDGDGDGGIVDKNIMNSTIDVNDSDSRLLPSSQGSVKSITGQLLCCIEGLFINRGSNKDSTLNSDKGFTFSKGSTIGLEIILWPEGTKTTSLLCIPIILPKENDIEAIVEIKKTFNMLITVALQQVTSVVRTSHSIIYHNINYINYHSFIA